ncbi:MAG: hypothetical protein AAGB93_03450 [Planctomycetota bacterium]
MSTSSPARAPHASSAAPSAFLRWSVNVGLAVPMIVFGLNKFFFFADVPPPAGETAQAFLGAMFSSYLAPLVAVKEILGGALVLFRKTSFLGLLVLAPLMANILAFHAMHDMPGNGIWVVSTLFYAAGVWRHRRDVAGLVAAA